MSSVNQPQDGGTGIPTGTEKREQATQKATGAGPELQVEELEERITPRLAANHNETML